jgi:O-antigen/teichoic acid export membrane protein
MFRLGIINVILRSLTLGSKFILLLFVASNMSPEDLGVFGLMSVTIAVSLYVVGMDYYAFNAREILARTEDEYAPLIRDQIVFHVIAYIVALPLLLSVFLFGLISWKYLGWFYMLVVVEHLSQESGRLLITLSRPTAAGIVLLVRSGIWVYVVIAAAAMSAGAWSLDFIWSVWFVGAFSSIALTAFVLRHLPWRRVLSVSVDWSRLKLGFRGSLPFLGATLALLGVQYADRYFIQVFHGEAMVGIYTFYANIANMVQVFVFTGIIMILYPKIISAYQRNHDREYGVLMRKLSLGVVAGVAVLSAVAAAGIRPALYLVGKEAFASRLPIFWIMLGAVALLTLSYIPHYGLYVRRKDKTIIGTAIAALVVALAVNAALVPAYGVSGAAWATFSGMATLCVLKFGCLRVVRWKAGGSTAASAGDVGASGRYTATKETGSVTAS